MIRVVIAEDQAMVRGALAALLKLSHDVHSLVKRMRDELGVVWELMPRSTLAEGLSRLQQSWAKQLSADVQPNVQTSGVAGYIGRSVQFFCEFCAGFAAAIEVKQFEKVYNRDLPIEIFAYGFGFELCNHIYFRDGSRSHSFFAFDVSRSAHTSGGFTSTHRGSLRSRSSWFGGCRSSRLGRRGFVFFGFILLANAELFENFAKETHDENPFKSNEICR